MGEAPLNEAEKATLVVSHLVGALQAQGVNLHQIVNALLLNAAASALITGCPTAAAFAEVSAEAFKRAAAGAAAVHARAEKV